MLLLQKIQWTLPTVQYNFTSTWIWIITSLLLVYSCFTVSGQSTPSMHKSYQAYTTVAKDRNTVLVFVFTIAQLMRSLDKSVLDSGWLWITSRFAFLPGRCSSLIYSACTNQFYFCRSLVKEFSCWALWMSVRNEGGFSMKCFHIQPQISIHVTFSASQVLMAHNTPNGVSMVTMHKRIVATAVNTKLLCNNL